MVFFIRFFDTDKLENENGLCFIMVIFIGIFSFGILCFFLKVTKIFFLGIYRIREFMCYDLKFVDLLFILIIKICYVYFY